MLGWLLVVSSVNAGTERSGAESESVDVVADSTEARTRRSIAAAEREDEDAEYA